METGKPEKYFKSEALPSDILLAVIVTSYNSKKYLQNALTL